VTDARRLPSLVAAALCAVACGPSFQILYECDVHFEHCYALDQGAVAPDAKKDCWRDWLHGYTYGQSRDRIEFAATRFSELSLDPTLPNEDVPGQRPRRRPDRPIAAPVPTNAFAPPPNVSDGHSGAEPSPASTGAREVLLVRVTTPPRPGADCAETCGETWNSCRASCKDHACDACDQTYRVCMPVCFHEEAAAARPVKSAH
jgi:hypothetical protein